MKLGIKENVEEIKKSISNGNAFNEKVTLVAATKMQTAEDINEAIKAGVDAVAENKVQEFRDKNDLVIPCPRHFIGHLQTNKVKFLVGKIDLFHSCDRDELANEIARLSLKKGVCSNILIQVNIGREETKGGYDPDSAIDAYKRLKEYESLRICGFMAMLPDSEDEALLVSLADKMRNIYDNVKKEDDNIKYLSMGMSGDYKLCVAHGSNMIRVGSTIFGKRNYNI